MSQSLVQIYLHFVFSTKHRATYLRDDVFRDRLHRYLAGACGNLDAPALQVGGTEDHVHILCRQSKVLALSDFLREFKRESSRWIKAEMPTLADFHWQLGYGAFSVSPSHTEGLKGYIASQVEHHRHETYQDEFRRLCRKYGLKLDERYAWD